MSILRSVVATLAALVLFVADGDAQTSAEMAALEARLMARLEMRLSEETQSLRSEQAVLRASVQEAVQTLARSENQMDRRAIAAVADGQRDAGLEVLEERARARDAQASASAAEPARQGRADEWRRIGAVAFLESTERSVEAFEQALAFTPDDPQLLGLIASLYERQGRFVEQRQVGERLVRLGDAPSRAKGGINIALAAAFAGENSDATRAADAAVAAARQAGQPTLLVEALFAQAISYAISRAFGPAERAADEAIAVARSNNLQGEEALAHFAAGQVYYVRASQSLFTRQSSLRRATSEFQSAARLFLAANNPAYQANSLSSSSLVEQMAGNAQSAEAHAREAIAILEPLQAAGYLSPAYMALGVALAKQERVAEARTAFQRSLDHARAVQSHRSVAFALSFWGVEELRWNNRVQACTLLTEASNLMDTRRLASELDRTSIRMQMGAACRAG